MSIHALKRYFEQYESAVVALSGGVDSSLVAKIANDVFGTRAIAVISASESLPESERQLAVKLCSEIGIQFREIKTTELLDASYRANDGNRCFVCKTYLYQELQAFAVSNGYDVVLDGANADDLSDYRPGRRAAKENNVLSPLAELGIGKEKVREIARELQLPNWNKPASACLASRVPYGTEVTKEILAQIEAAEEILRDAGFLQFRVRHHDTVARIEIPPDEFFKMIEARESVTKQMKQLGYKFISLDLDGFRSGSMNELLVQISQ
jgi:uncharacterized protein